jgi:pimeloyl-ACP methyl ester carboxylesterase
VLLIHGFGASIGHWRHTIPSLAEQAEVHALDLLGFGGSDKPRSRLIDEPEQPDTVRYGFDLWGQQVVDYIQDQMSPRPTDLEQLQGPAAPDWSPAASDRSLHLVGNSIGAVVALNAASLLQRQHQQFQLAQVVLIDCAQRALDNKRLAELPAAQRWSRPLLMGVVRQRWLINALFPLLARPSMVRQVLAQAYPSGANVDNALVELLVAPSRDPGARESFRGFVNLFNDQLASDLLACLEVPVRMLWGEQDPWEPVAEARRWAGLYPCIQELVVLPGLGHCPHDESPERVNPILMGWIQQATATAQLSFDPANTADPTANP